jgi:hypothetical protein
MKIESKMQEHDWVNVYYYDQIMIVPHYVKKDVFVLPGGKEVKESVLIENGFRQATSYLWPRVTING